MNNKSKFDYVSKLGKYFKLSSNPPLFKYGQDEFLFTANKKKFLDFSCGSGTTILGHNNPYQVKNLKSKIDIGLFHTGPHFMSPIHLKYFKEFNSFVKKDFNVETEFDCSCYPTDGTVYKLWDGNRFRELGYTSKHPRGAFALKEQAEGVETTLVDVVWQLGKSGVVSPVAILDPILIGDATVSRATLHNIEYIRDLNLEIGCSVEVIRSGEIIPRVVRRLD